MRAVAACVIIATCALPVAARAATAALSGVVVDSASGLRLSNASITANGPSSATTTADRDGRFAFAALPNGVYTLTARSAGYQTALSDAVTVFAGSSARVTLNLQRIGVGQTNLRTIARTTVNASGSLEKSSVLYQQVSAEQLRSRDCTG